MSNKGTKQNKSLDNKPEGDGLWITGLRVENFAGFHEFELDLGALTVLAGANATGKTSLLEAIEATLSRGGFTDDMINIDADKSEVRVSMTGGLEVKTTRRRGKSPVVKVSQDGVPVSRPRALLDELLDPVSLDPLAWLEGDRTQALLDAMPLKISAKDIAELYERAGVDKNNRLHIDASSMKRHALQVLADFEKDLVTRRRMANAEVKQLTTWMKKEREAQVSELSNDPFEEMEKLREEATGIQLRIAENKRIADDFDAAEREVEKAEDRYMTKLKRIEDLKQQLSIAEDEADRLKEDVAEAEVKKYASPPVSASGTLIIRNDSITSQLNILQERRGRYLEGLEQKGRVDSEAERLLKVKKEAATLDAGVQTFRSAPGKLLAEADLPVEGLEFVDGHLTQYGVSVSRLSGAETIRLATQVAVYRVKQQRGQFILLDGLEKLDTAQRIVMLEEIRASAVQWILTEVGLRGDVADGTVVVVGTI